MIKSSEVRLKYFWRNAQQQTKKMFQILSTAYFCKQNSLRNEIKPLSPRRWLRVNLLCRRDKRPRVSLALSENDAKCPEAMIPSDSTIDSYQGKTGDEENHY